jgi:hypothetical protein
MLCMMSRITLYCPMQEEIEEIGPMNCQEISKNEVFCNEPFQEASTKLCFVIYVVVLFS